MSVFIGNTTNTKYFSFQFDGEDTIYTIPQTLNDGSDTVQFSSNWTKLNLPGSTEPMVAFNFVDAPTVPIQLKFHEDMWREAGLNPSGYRNVINKFVSLIYPGENGEIIRPPYCMLYVNDAVYRGYFTSIRVNQYGIIRNGYKTSCEISASFTIIKRTAPKRLGVSNGFRVYFNAE